MAQFNHFELSLLNPGFDSPFVDALTGLECKILHRVVELGAIKAKDLHPVLPDLKPSQVTYPLSKLIERGLLQATEAGARAYTAKFSNSYLAGGVINALQQQGFIASL